ncbi:hypothetical protein DFH09DRAFT_1097121 [Mycena vulgaris]|nr:hypothetical protein DFH09DRAFT_1097121 [Mycena vulgaris]
MCLVGKYVPTAPHYRIPTFDAHWCEPVRASAEFQCPLRAQHRPTKPRNLSSISIFYKFYSKTDGLPTFFQSLQAGQIPYVTVGFRTGPPAGTRRPTRTRTRQYRTRPTRGFKPVRVTRGSLIYPRFLRKTADRNAAAIWHGTLFSRPQKAGTASAECRLRLPSTRGLTRAGPRYCGGSEISTRTRTRQTLGSKPANGPDTRAEPYGSKHQIGSTQ